MPLRSILLTGFALGTLILSPAARAECPEGTWPRSQYTGPGGGLYKGPGGGLYTGPGGGMYTGPGEYCRNMPPWSVLLTYLDENGYEKEASLIREAMP